MLLVKMHSGALKFESAFDQNHLVQKHIYRLLCEAIEFFIYFSNMFYLFQSTDTSRRKL